MAVLNKRYTNRWQAQIWYVFSKATGNVDNTSCAQVATRQFETPNLALVNADGPASYTPTHEFKLLGSYQIPKIETTVQRRTCAATSGLPYARVQQFSSSTLNTTGLSSTYRRLNITSRDAYSLPNLSQLDLRIEKTFMVSSNRFGIYADLQNIFNKGTITSVIQRPTSITLLDEYGLPAALQHAGDGSGSAPDPHRRALVLLGRARLSKARARSASSRRARVLYLQIPHCRPPDGLESLRGTPSPTGAHGGPGNCRAPTNQGRAARPRLCRGPPDPTLSTASPRDVARAAARHQSRLEAPRCVAGRRESRSCRSSRFRSIGAICDF